MYTFSSIDMHINPTSSDMFQSYENNTTLVFIYLQKQSQSQHILKIIFKYISWTKIKKNDFNHACLQNSFIIFLSCVQYHSVRLYLKKNKHLNDIIIQSVSLFTFISYTLKNKFNNPSYNTNTSLYSIYNS